MQDACSTLHTSASIWEFPGDGYSVLARPDFQGLFLLNSSACAIWDLVRQGAPADQIAVAYSELFGISQSVAAADVQATIEAWRTQLLAPESYNTGKDLQAPVPPAKVPGLDEAIFVSHYSLNGISFRMAIHDPELVEEFAPRLAPLKADTTAADIAFDLVSTQEGVLVFRDGILFLQEALPSSARAILLPELVRLSLHREEDWLAILHASSCGTADRSVLFPAAGEQGKSTLVAALMHAGLSFYCEDSAAVERHTLRVARMPFSLMIREGSWPLLQSRFPELAKAPVMHRYGHKVRFLPPMPSTSASASVLALIFIRLDTSGPATLRKLETFESLLRLQQSGFWVAHDRSSIQTFLDWIRLLPSYELAYSDLDEATRLVRQVLDV